MNSAPNPNPVSLIPEAALFTEDQRAWLSGFLVGLFAAPSLAGLGQSTPTAAVAPRPPLLILYGSQTGTAEQLAKRLGAEADQRGFASRVLEMSAWASIDLKSEPRLLLVTSTWGDGDPPDNAVAFWNFLNSDAAPKLDHLAFSVLALGDRNYSDFCGAGKKFDARLEQLGAKRFLPCAECDVDYEAPAKAWMDAVWTTLGTKESAVAPVVAPVETQAVGWSKTNPFPARLLTNRLLGAPGSAKETRHFEISLRDSGLNYEVGDALGVMPANCPALADEILAALRCDGEEGVKLANGNELSLRKALLDHFQITRITQPLLAAFAEHTKDAHLAGLLNPANKPALEKFLYGREIIHLLLAHPEVKFTPAEFTALLPKLQPRLYSISSSPKAHPGEVHLTVAVVRYDGHGRPCKGVCSTFLAERAGENVPVPVFIQTSHGSRLPADPAAPVIMIGPGTGIAPFRAFLEERRAIGAKGKNWLFFGDQKCATDFLYADELENFRRDGHLTRLDTAFSRDQADKIYVQHRMLEAAAEFWSWLESGAHVYVCGDAKRMAADVDIALQQLIQTAGARTPGQAADYVQKLRHEKRYQRDVY